jgi:hypothetical protein
VLLPFGIVSLGYLLFAASNAAFFNSTQLWNLPLSNGILNILDLFRASARFIWPVFYFLVLFGLIAAARNMRHPELLLLPILLIQFFDIQPLYSSKRVKGYAEYASKMQDSFWSEAAKTNKSIVIIPTEYYEQVVLYADKNHMTVNSGYFARADYQAMETNALQVWNDLLAGKSDPQTLYLLSEPKYVDSAAANLSKSMYVCNFNDYAVLFSRENEVAKMAGDLDAHCTIPKP